MGEVIEGIAAAERERISALLKDGKFFWVDVSLGQTSRDELGEALDIPSHAMDRLVDFREDTPPSSKFDSDGERVVFAFSCFLDTADSAAGSRDRCGSSRSTSWSAATSS